MSETAVVRYARPMDSAVQSPENFEQLLLSSESEITALIRRKDITALQVIGSAKRGVLESERPDLIFGCTATSIQRSVLSAVDLSLSFGRALGQAWLVPFGKQCQLMIGHKGWVVIVYDTCGALLDTGVVYKGDGFEPHLGTESSIIHIPNMAIDRSREADGNIVAFYAVATMPDGRRLCEVMSLKEVQQVRAASKMSRGGPWKDWFSEMGRKTTIRRIVKRLPLTGEHAERVNRALKQENETGGFGHGMTNGTTPEERAGELHAWVEGEVVANAEAPAPTSDDPLISARKHIGNLAELLAQGGRAKGKNTDAGKVIAYATKEALGDALGLEELSFDQAVLVKELLESQQAG